MGKYQQFIDVRVGSIKAVQQKSGRSGSELLDTGNLVKFLKNIYPIKVKKNTFHSDGFPIACS